MTNGFLNDTDRIKQGLRREIYKGSAWSPPEARNKWYRNGLSLDTMSLDGLVVLITGASRGIGRAIALKAAADGAKVIVNYLSDVEAADSVVSQIGADRAVAVQADISKIQEVEYLVHSAVSRFGKIDVLIPNAVYMPAGDIEALTEDQFDRTFGVNVKGPCFLVQVCSA